MIPQHSGFKTKDEYLARIFGSDGVPKNTSVGASKMLENVGRGLVSLQPPPSYIDLGHVILDIASIEPKTPDDAIRYWTERGRVMAALSDYYSAVKQIIRNREHNRETHLDRQLLASIRNNLDRGQICSDDRLIYSNTFGTRIFQHYGANDSTLRSSTDLHIRPCIDEKLEVAFYDLEILKLIQFLCKTNDNREELVRTFEVMSNKSKDKLVIFTPSMDYRKRGPLVSVFMLYSGTNFRIDFGYDVGYFVGHSRGVRYEKKATCDLEK